MRALLDINVLIALLDSDHSMHEQAAAWMAKYSGSGWASCPLTQNGCVRIMSHPSYPNAPPLQDVAGRLREACATDLHEFWPDDISLLDGRAVDISRVHGPRQITDVYLLALAFKNGGRFVTFDAAASARAVPGAEERHLLHL